VNLLPILNDSLAEVVWTTLGSLAGLCFGEVGEEEIELRKTNEQNNQYLPTLPKFWTIPANIQLSDTTLKR